MLLCHLNVQPNGDFELTLDVLATGMGFGLAGIELNLHSIFTRARSLNEMKLK